MSPPEDDFEYLESGIEDLKSSIEDLNDEIKNVNYDMEELKFSKKEYEIYLFPTTIKRYVDNIINIQQRKNELFFPSSEMRIKEYFKTNFTTFDHTKIKYNPPDDFDVICKIISDQGRSGSSFIENVGNVIDINKPLLLYYGIEQISAFYFNLHFNFTWKNEDFNKIRDVFTRHGIDAFNFKNDVDISDPVEDLLNKKIKLRKAGLAQRFFLTIAPEFLQYFSNETEFTLIDLLKFFYLFNPIPYKTRKIFEELYGSKNNLSKNLIDFYYKHTQRLDLFIIYLLSFIFCHMCRYKLYAWTLILNSEKKNIGYFIRFFLDYSKKYFIKKVFDEVFENAELIKGMLEYSIEPLF